MASTVLVIGSRGHAACRCLYPAERHCSRYCVLCSGNPSMASDGIRTVLLDESDHAAIIDFIRG